MKNITTTSFGLAKQNSLVGDDFFLVKTYDNLTIAIVCDGVGSACEGALAAKRVCEHIVKNFKTRPQSWSIQKTIDKFITSINAILYKESMQNYERSELVTTLALVIIDANRLYGANVGDSRVYLSRDASLTQLSHDHSMSEKGYENVLTQAIGLEETVSPYYFENIIQSGDKIMLCSDGLYTVLTQTQLIKGTNSSAYSLVKKASSLTKDNLFDDTTAVVIDIHKVENKAVLKQQHLEIPQTLKKGMIIDGYELLKPLIQNERTWRVHKNSLTYIMKFAPTNALEDMALLDMFINEACNAKKLKAGFFPKAVIPKNQTMRYYILQDIHGITLKEHISKKVLSVEDAILLAKTLLSMSQYLLKYDLVHGDIKPENIIISKKGDKHLFKIIDFGSIVELYSINTRAGTPSYLSPQRLLGDAISEISEIFAIGVTLHEALTQKFPYKEIEPFQSPTFRQAVLPSSINKNIPNWLDSVLLRSISIDENTRYKNYSQMTYDLNHHDEVEPYFDMSQPLFIRDPLKFYKYSFVILLGLNIFQYFY